MYSRKNIIRKEIKLIKSWMSDEDKIRKSNCIWRQIESLEYFQKAEVVLMYWSMRGEVYTHDFILHWHKEKTIILPVVDGDSLHLRKFKGEHALCRHATMNLYEPQGDDYLSPQNIKLVIIPGIAFDRHNHRLGRGKGYYDKLLPQLNAYKIGVGFDFQLLEDIPDDPHDVPMDEVVVG